CGRAESLRDVGIVEGTALSAVSSVCLDCEHGFLRRRPTSQWFDQFYSKAWDQSGQDRLEKGKTGMQPDPKVLQFCAPHLSGPTDVLDVGAGFGRSLLAF